MGDAAGMTGMIHVCGMNHYDAAGMTCEMIRVYGMTHDDVEAEAEMVYNDNGISASVHSNNSNLTNRMGMVNKKLI